MLAHGNADVAGTRDFAGVLADARAPGLIDGADYFYVHGLLRRANHRAAHAPADSTDDNSQGHLILQQPKIAERYF
jgi:hypothetical protein